MSFSFPKAILFDWDNTLIDSEKSCFHAINATLVAFGQTALTFKTFCQMPPLSIRVFFKNIFQEKDLETAEKIYLKHASRLSLTPFSTSKPLLDWLWHHEIPMAVVSNKHGNLLRKEIAGLGWGNFFYTTVGSYDTPEDKPSPTPLLHALTVKKMPPNHHVWFVGDSLIDMNCAKNAGCMPVALGVEAERYGHTMIRAGNGHGLLSLLQDLKTSSTTGDK